jgi:alpha-ribazole phosphatase
LTGKCVNHVLGILCKPCDRFTPYFGGKECVQDVIDRVAEALTDATLCGAPEMVWVTHAGVIRAVQFLSTKKKRTKISLANEWPSSAPSMGQWICLEISK